MLEYHPPAKYLQILQWDSSAPEQDQDQCNKTVMVVVVAGGRGEVWYRSGNKQIEKPSVITLKTKN